MGDLSSPFKPFSARLVLDTFASAGGVIPPWHEALSAVLESAFRVSLYEDEGRPLRFALGLTGLGRVLSSEEFLETAVPATAEGLLRLSVVVNPRESCLHVACSPDGTAQVVGICARPQLSGRAEGDPLFLVDVRGPAMISARDANVEVRYQRDDCYVPSGRAVLERHLPLDVEDAVSTLLRPERESRGFGWQVASNAPLTDAAWQRHGARILERVRAIAPGILAEALVTTVAEVRRLGHGGVLVVTESAADELGAMKLRSLGEDARAFDHARRSPLEEPWNRGLLEHLAWSALRDVAREGIALVETGDELDPLAWAATVGETRCERALVRTRADARRCAHLTQVDGAVVLDAVLEPQLFGLKITLDNQTWLPEEWRAFLAPRGTRHRAGACLAEALDGALVLVISQDGSVTMFRKRMGSEVLASLSL